MENFAHLYSQSALNHVFNTETLERIIPVTVAFDPSRYIPTGSPGLVLEREKIQDDRVTYRDETVLVMFPFPTAVSLSPGTCVEVLYKNLYPLPQKNLVTNHRVKEIQEFYLSELPTIGKYVVENAAITFVIPDLEETLGLWANLPNLCSMYKYSVFFNHKATARKRRLADDKFLPFISFIDIPYCIPTFDHRNLDGMGIQCGFVYKSGKNYMHIDSLFFVLSNNPTNLLYLDGEKLNEPSKIHKDILGYIRQLIITEINYNESRKTKATQKKNDIKEGLVKTKKEATIFPNINYDTQGSASIGQVITTSSATTTW